MVLGILTAVAACPAIIGVNETVIQGQRQNARSSHRGRKTNLVVSCNDPCPEARQINGCYIVLRNNKAYVSTLNSRDNDGHRFAGYFLPHPDHKWGRKGEGLVSTISDDPPFLNWIYVDEQTYEVKYGTRAESGENLLGPWSCTPIEKRLTFDGWEGFAVVEERDGDDVQWALYFDVNDDGLGEKVRQDRRVLEIELTRKEMRMPPVEVEDDGPQ